MSSSCNKGETLMYEAVAKRRMDTDLESLRDNLFVYDYIICLCITVSNVLSDVFRFPVASVPVIA